jgi:hypothetical protein
VPSSKNFCFILPKGVGKFISTHPLGSKKPLVVKEAEERSSGPGGAPRRPQGNGGGGFNRDRNNFNDRNRNYNDRPKY